MSSNCSIYNYKPKLAEGNRFGKLVAIEYVGHKKLARSYISQWLFRCDCGSETIKNDIAVRRGHTKSCSRSCSAYLGKGISLTRCLYNRYKRIALSKELEFSIDRETFTKLSTEKCYYCGVPPIQNYYKNKRESLAYNGVDRVDNKLGYTKNNCVSCCLKCNRAKSNMSVSDFKEWFNSLLDNKCKLLFDGIAD